jgi:very-short-patch-repair endonuclease
MTTRAERVTAFNDWLRTHEGVITTAALIGLGFSTRTISRMVSRGVLVRIGPGVYRSATHADSEIQRMIAVCSTCPEAGIGFTTAGRHYNLRGTKDRDVHALVPHTVRTTWPGVIVHRCRDIAPVDISLPDECGIRYTSPPRTVHDSGSILGTTKTASIVEQGLREKLFTIATLVDTSGRLFHPRRPGATVLRDVLASRPTWRNSARSELERKLREAIEVRGLPAPAVNEKVVLPSGEIIEVDLSWKPWSVVGEVDHPYWHDGDLGAHQDKRRDRKLLTMGIATARFTNIDVEAGLNEALDDLTDILVARGWRPGTFAPCG